MRFWRCRSGRQSAPRAHPAPSGTLRAVQTTIRTAGEAETRRLAGALASGLRPGDLVTLSGALGAGKTVFVRGLCEGLEVPASAGVSSPSYALVHLYEGGRLPVAHLDLYRLSGGDELEALGFRDLCSSAHVVFVEWPERAEGLVLEADVAIALEDLGPEVRSITVRATELDPAADPTLAERLRAAAGSVPAVPPARSSEEARR